MSAAREGLRNKIRKALLTDEAMVRVLDDLFGRENYAYDPQNDVWVIEIMTAPAAPSLLCSVEAIGGR
jgi:hypothetical protein